MLARRESAEGMATLKQNEFAPVLASHLNALDLSRAGPVMICGMAGAAQGWLEARYIDLPAKLSDVPAAAVRVPVEGSDIRILPGFAQRDHTRPDVIRGEETLLLGAHLGRQIEGMVCLPGTHSKWASIEDGCVTRFRTAMTGEIFTLLARNSTLTHYVDADDPDLCDRPAFSQAVKESVGAPAHILQSLFSVRAGPLVAVSEPEDMAARLSGLLIGQEIAGARWDASEGLTIIASGPLAKAYGTAFEALGVEVQLLESEDIIVDGLYHAAKAAWGIGK